MQRLLHFTVWLFLGSTTMLFAQNEETARQLAASGKHAEAEAQYLELIRQNPKNVQAIIGAAYNNAWNGYPQRALPLFDAALRLEPTSQAAVFGKAYTMAWNGQWKPARALFQQVLDNDPNNTEARKGMGYVCLWQGNGAAAADYFVPLAQTFPKENEYNVALAQAYLQQNQYNDALRAIRQGLAQNPQHAALRTLYQSAQNAAAPLEIEANGGYSLVNGSGKFGLRNLSVNAKITTHTRAYFRFDNALSLDLSALVRSRLAIRAYALGTVHQWNSRWITRGEYGLRSFPGRQLQQVLSGEQVYLLGRGYALKAGGFYGWGQDAPSESLAYLSARVPVTRWWALEPYYFRSSTANTPKPEQRWLLNQQFRSEKGHELHIAGYWGRTWDTSQESGTSPIKGVVLNAIVPLHRRCVLQGGFRYEVLPFDQLLSASLGLRIRIDY